MTLPDRSKQIGTAFWELLRNGWYGSNRRKWLRERGVAWIGTEPFNRTHLPGEEGIISYRDLAGWGEG